jgi:hypothetical protein
MDNNSLFKLGNKKALSTVIATVLLILLVLVATTIVWTFVRNIINERTQGTQDCFDAQSTGKVAINNYYTCYNPSSGEVQFSIDIGDIQIDSLIISILVGGNSKSFTLTNDYTADARLKSYPAGNYGEPLKLPGKNEGLTYVASGFAGTKADSIKIAPVINGKQCDSSDETYEISDCSLFEN